MEEQDFWRANQAGRYLGVSKANIYQMVARREIPFIRLGRRRVLFRKIDLDNFINSKLVSPINQDGYSK